MSSMNIRNGEYVLHAQHGVGKITSIRTCSFSGHAAAKYVQLYFVRDELTMEVLKEALPGVVRSLISPEQAWDLLEQIAEWNGKPQAQWKARANAHQAALDSGDPFEYLKVLKELALLESGDALCLGDREHLSRSLCLLTEELACALKKSPRRVHRLLTDAVGATL